MKVVFIFTALLAAAAMANPVSPAGPKADAEELFARDSGECRSRWRYCGKTLLNMGWNRRQIIGRVRNREEATWLGENNLDNVLFSCGRDSELWFNSSCNKPGQCVNAGANRDDYCS